MANGLITVEVVFHANIEKLFGEGERRITLSGQTRLRRLLETVCDSDERRQRIFDQRGGLRSDVTILRNGRNVVFLDGLETVLNNGDKVAIFPPVYGG
ncbi:MAG: ubiquitin-like small modifier protein 1 [Thermodesulfobacteriota bacterium]